MKKKIFKYLKKKYVIVLLSFIVIIVFIDDNNLAMLFKLQGQLNELKDKKEYYLKEISKDSANTVELTTNYEKIEQFGREEYNMKRKNEDIFIIQKEESE